MKLNIEIEISDKMIQYAKKYNIQLERYLKELIQNFVNNYINEFD